MIHGETPVSPTPGCSAIGSRLTGEAEIASPVCFSFLQYVSLPDPVVPIGNGISSTFVGLLGWFYLRKRHGQLSSLPRRLDEHLMITFLSRSHPNDFNFITFAERGDGTLADTAREKWELQLVSEVRVPARRLLFRSIRIHDDLIANPFFPTWVFFRRWCGSSQFPQSFFPTPCPVHAGRGRAICTQACSPRSCRRYREHA